MDGPIPIHAYTKHAGIIIINQVCLSKRQHIPTHLIKKSTETTFWNKQQHTQTSFLADLYLFLFSSCWWLAFQYLLNCLLFVYCCLLLLHCCFLLPFCWPDLCLYFLGWDSSCQLSVHFSSVVIFLWYFIVVFLSSFCWPDLSMYFLGWGISSCWWLAVQSVLTFICCFTVVLYYFFVVRPTSYDYRLFS